MDLVRCLLTPLVPMNGSESEGIYLALWAVYQCLVRENTEWVGKLWKLDQAKRTLQPGEVAHLPAFTRLNWKHSMPYIILKANTKRRDIWVKVISKVLPTREILRLISTTTHLHTFSQQPILMSQDIGGWLPSLSSISP